MCLDTVLVELDEAFSAVAKTVSAEFFSQVVTVVRVVSAINDVIDCEVTVVVAGSIQAVVVVSCGGTTSS